MKVVHYASASKASWRCRDDIPEIFMMANLAKAWFSRKYENVLAHKITHRIVAGTIAYYR